MRSNEGTRLQSGRSSGNDNKTGNDSPGTENSKENKQHKFELMKTRDFSLLKFVNDMANKTQEYSLGAKEAMEAVGKRSDKMGIVLPMNSRAIDPDTSGLTQGKTLLERLRIHSLFMRAGARYMGGLVADADVVSEDKYTECGWPKLGAVLADPDPTEWSMDVIKPLRVYCELPVSFQMLHQTGQAGEDYFADLLMRSLANELDRAILNGEGDQATTHEPTGLLNNTDISSEDLSGPVTWAKIIECERRAAKNVYDSPELKYAYMVDATLKEKLKISKKDAGSGIFLLDTGNSDGRMNGYNVLTTEHMASDSLIFGNFFDLMVLQWSGIDLIINKHSFARQGFVLITAGMWVNIHVAKPENFYILKDIE